VFYCHLQEQRTVQPLFEEAEEEATSILEPVEPVESKPPAKAPAKPVDSKPPAKAPAESAKKNPSPKAPKKKPKAKKELAEATAGRCCILIGFQVLPTHLITNMLGYHCNTV